MADDKSKDDELAGTEQPFVQHLFELRDRLIKAMAAIAVATVVLALYPGPAALYDIMAAPLVAHLPKGATLIATSVISPFMVPLKIMLMAAFLLALPVVLWQVWAFVAPGLYSHEKKLVLPLVISSTVLFFVGVAFCYFFVFGRNCFFFIIQQFFIKFFTGPQSYIFDFYIYIRYIAGKFYHAFCQICNFDRASHIKYIYFSIITKRSSFQDKSACFRYCHKIADYFRIGNSYRSTRLYLFLEIWNYRTI